MVFVKIQWKKLILCLAVPLGVGGLSALVTRRGVEEFQALAKPPLTPPQWVFPVVWTLLFVLMGLASYLMWTSSGPQGEKRGAWTVYGVQLAVNFLWSIFFFNLKAHLLAFAWLVFLWVLITVTMARFRRLSQTADRLLIPYLVWVTFAGYLNCGVWLLNR